MLDYLNYMMIDSSGLLLNEIYGFDNDPGCLSSRNVKIITISSENSYILYWQSNNGINTLNKIRRLFFYF